MATQTNGVVKKKTSSAKSRAASATAGPPTGSSKLTPTETLYQALVKGLQGGSLGAGEIVLPTGATTAAAIVSTLEAGLLDIGAVKSSHATWRAAVATQDAMEKANAPLIQALRQFLRARFGAKSLKLAEFGIVPRPAKVRTTAAKAAAAQKGQTTRKSKKGVLAPPPVVAPPAPANGTHAVASGTA